MDTITKDLGWAVARLYCQDGKGEHLELFTPTERLESGEAIPAQSINLPEDHLIALMELLKEGKLIGSPDPQAQTINLGFLPAPVAAEEPASPEQLASIKAEWKRIYGDDEESARDTMAALTGKRSLDRLTKWEADQCLEVAGRMPDYKEPSPEPPTPPAPSIPVTKETSAAILAEWNRLYGDVLGDVAAREQSRCHLRVHTTKTKRSALTEAEATTYLGILNTMTHETTVGK